VFDTEFGKIGIVICYDRHLPESIRTCVCKGADLILIPTANTKAEPLEMFEWEIRVQAMQSQAFIAMCNRVGQEGEMDFAGESLVVHPSGDVLCKANDREELLTCELDLREAAAWQKKKPYWSSRRPEWYL
jgi:predicted amidohydrolase